MDQKTASVLLASLLERIERDHTIGAVSSLEKHALQLALQALGGAEATATAPVITPIRPDSRQGPFPRPVDAPVVAATTPPKVDLVLTSIERDSPTNPEVMLCLDFGTAMSKAFATVYPDDHRELPLGEIAGRQGYTLPSSVFIGDDGKAYFGFEAIDLSQELVESGRERLDSIKHWLSLRREGNLDGESCVLQPSLNPTAVRLTQGDLIRIYLAYLTDVAGVALGEHAINDRRIERYVRRRFARPCWPDENQAKSADALMRSMIAEAQILADTFNGRWSGGIDVAELKAAVEKVKALGKRPDYIIEAGVAEPVAVAAGAFGAIEDFRDAFMVVDVGAGTTDFGLFVSTRPQGVETVRVFQVPASIQGLMQAGDKVDGMLRAFIAQRESIDSADNAGRMNMADLGRKIRTLKETLFTAGELEYALADGTIGRVNLAEFLADERVKRFAASVEEGFRKALEAVDDSWLHWLAMPGVRLRVVLTGGSSQLPMVRGLTEGAVQVKGLEIRREAVNQRPEWLEDVSEELRALYPQLAVAIGGSAEEMPQTLTAPPVFGGGVAQPTYVPGRMQITGR